jgi:hypothetical protein
LGNAHAIRLVHKDELEALAQLKRPSLGTAAQINDITTNLGGALVDVHCEFTPLGQGRVGQLWLFIWVTNKPHHFVQWVGAIYLEKFGMTG